LSYRSVETDPQLWCRECGVAVAEEIL